eukprot:scaffold120669_cov17-Tisochrysis_lutea.AAC.2
MKASVASFTIKESEFVPEPLFADQCVVQAPCSRTCNQPWASSSGENFLLTNYTYTSYATDGEVHVILVGEVASWPGIDVVKSNHDGACQKPSMVVFKFSSVLTARSGAHRKHQTILLCKVGFSHRRGSPLYRTSPLPLKLLQRLL